MRCSAGSPESRSNAVTIQMETLRKPVRNNQRMQRMNKTAGLRSWTKEGNQEGLLRAHVRYKEAKKEAKEAVAQAKEKAYEEL
ncbi:hypothetical protein Tco_1546367 [Tanacetum coccineum]